MKTIYEWWAVAAIAAAVSGLACGTRAAGPVATNNAVVSDAAALKVPFKLLANFKVRGKVAEIVAATPNGKTVFYTDSVAREIGIIDISDAAAPRQVGGVAMPGEPTSVGVTRDGKWVLAVVHGTPDQLVVLDAVTRAVAARHALAGQPDCIALSPSGKYAAIAIENERQDMKKPMPQSPAGCVQIVDLEGAPKAWKLRTVALSGLATRFPTDPEPEYISINRQDQAAVTLQENNSIVIVDLRAGHVVRCWSAGTVAHAADTRQDGKVDFADQIVDAPREPDAIAWTAGGNLITANEGDYDLDLAAGQFSGGRGFTIFDPAGTVRYDAGAGLEQGIAAAGHYKDKRSDKHGVEPEGVAVGRYGERELAFIGCERAGAVAVYDVADASNPTLLQVLAVGDKPEGLVAIPARGLFISANEGDGTLSIFGRQ